MPKKIDTGVSLNAAAQPIRPTPYFVKPLRPFDVVEQERPNPPLELVSLVGRRLGFKEVLAREFFDSGRPNRHLA